MYFMECVSADLIVPVVELLGTRLAAEVPGHTSERSGYTSLTELVAVVTAHTFQTQTLNKILLE